MAEKSNGRKAFDAVLACALWGGGTMAVTWGVLTFLGPKSSDYEIKRTVEFAEAVTEEPNDYVADVRAAAQLARELWAYAELRAETGEVDLAALEQECLELLGETPDAASFRQAILRFTGGLHDGHAGVRWTSELREPTKRWPFNPVLVLEGVAIDGIAEGVEGVSRGDLILEVDGRTIEACLDEAEGFVCASTSGARRVAALRALSRSSQAADHEFKLQRADGSVVEQTFSCLASTSPVPSSSRIQGTRTSRLEQDGMGYFRPENFQAPAGVDWAGADPSERNPLLAMAYEGFDTLLEPLSAATAIVLDLRGNPGGTDLLGQFLTDRLLESEDYVYYRLSSLQNRGWSRFSSAGSDAPSGRAELRQPLAVLIDEETFSVADNVAFCLADNHPNVTFIGRPNGAGSGAPRGFELPRTGVRVYFCTMRVRRAIGGDLMEGQPLLPDLPVTWTRADLLEDRDPDLEAAIARLNSQ